MPWATAQRNCKEWLQRQFTKQTLSPMASSKQETATWPKHANVQFIRQSCNHSLLKYSHLSSGWGLIVPSPGFQSTGQTTPC